MKKMAIEPFDPAEYLNSPEAIQAYIEAALEENDTELLKQAIADVAKAIGMTRISQETGLGRESLYKSLKPGSKPGFDTVIKILNAIGLDFVWCRVSFRWRLLRSRTDEW